MRVATLALAALLTVTAAASAQDSTAAKHAAPKGTGMGPRAVVLQTVVGDIVIKLRPDAAPKTVANFRKLVMEKYYDGTAFHRVIQGFMIQGGDPNSKDSDPTNDGLGGPSYTVPAEIKLPHLRG